MSCLCSGRNRLPCLSFQLRYHKRFLNYILFRNKVIFNYISTEAMLATKTGAFHCPRATQNHYHMPGA